MFGSRATISCMADPETRKQQMDALDVLQRDLAKEYALWQNYYDGEDTEGMMDRITSQRLRCRAAFEAYGDRQDRPARTVLSIGVSATLTSLPAAPLPPRAPAGSRQRAPLLAGISRKRASAPQRGRAGSRR